MENCQPADPVSVIIFHGTADEHVLYNGGEPVQKVDRHFRVDNSVSYAVSFWLKHNGCSETARRSEKGSIRTEIYSGGKDGAEVVLYTVNGGGHAWPGRAGVPAWFGTDKRDFRDGFDVGLFCTPSEEMMTTGFSGTTRYSLRPKT